MKIYRFLLIAFAQMVLGAACKTTSGASHTTYANESTDLDSVRKKTCVNYKKEGDCILRLIGYEADANVISAIEKDNPRPGFGIKADPKEKEEMIERAIASGSKYGLPLAEVTALVAYTGEMYSEMNSALRGNPENWAKHQNLIFGAASALTHLKALKVKGLVYRSEKTDQAKVAKFL